LNITFWGYFDLNFFILPCKLKCTTFEGTTTSAVSEDQEDSLKFLEKGSFYPSFGLDEES